MVRGAGSYGFNHCFNMFEKAHSPPLVTLMEPRISGSRANGFDQIHRVIYITFVYASPNANIRKSIRDKLRMLNPGDSVPWLVGGDFNAILRTEDRSGGVVSRMGINQDFNNFVIDQALVDIRFDGPWFIWVRSYLRQRIDRFLANDAWLTQFLNSFASHIVRIGFDHRQARLLDWNRNEFGKIGKRKNQLIARIQGIDSVLAQRESASLINLENRLKIELESVLHYEESLWFQKSRCN
ncbi:uncharacterized protein LOC120214431 [Hibiscus syriacus]|uniref:uncharacterized protein LOC120214431 n=1 Tax=Hibiscus syriacus TaxID=106335 RepID=UPI001922E665|nr:uncharacterized protein LOC120214431 [Hibiscus syriacus]